MSLAAALIPELEHEARSTRRLLERVPADRLDYRPHPRSMTLGQLALHIAAIPGSISRLAALDDIDTLTVDFNAASPDGAAQILATLDTSLAEAKAYLGGLDEETCAGTFTARAGERVIFALPRLMVLRNLMFNHLYHHRGQMTVYLRLLDVPVPATYGRSADENPFG